MADKLYREFLISSPSIWKLVTKFISANASAFIERGTPLKVIVAEEESDRFDEQVKYYFGIVVKTIAEQAWVEGRRYDKDAWHEQLARDFLPTREIVTPDGEIILKRSSIARGRISNKAMAKYTQEVTAYATTELGVIFDE